MKTIHLKDHKSFLFKFSSQFFTLCINPELSLLMATVKITFDHFIRLNGSCWKKIIHWHHFYVVAKPTPTKRKVLKCGSNSIKLYIMFIPLVANPKKKSEGFSFSAKCVLIHWFHVFLSFVQTNFYVKALNGISRRMENFLLLIFPFWSRFSFRRLPYQ